jgi:hypothetical protein
MSAEIVEISKRREPVTYTVTLTHHWDDTVEVFVHDVADDDRSRAAVGDALARAAEAFMNRRIGAAADAMHAIMLANIDSAMGCTDAAPSVMRIAPAELASWADAVQSYESARWPLKEVSP